MGLPVPAPAPAVNAWDKPIKLAVTDGALGDPSKYDKGDQHDSGIDISEPHNSASSSTRSSPSAENKIKGDDILSKVCRRYYDGTRLSRHWFVCPDLGKV